MQLAKLVVGSLKILDYCVEDVLYDATGIRITIKVIQLMKKHRSEKLGK